MDDMRDRLIELLAKYFTIGDSYAYNLTRVKEAFAVGTVTIDDFVEFDEEVVADIADYLLADKEISRAFELLHVEKEGRLILLPCKVGERIYKVYKDCHLPGDCYTKRMCSRCEYAEFGIEEAFFEFSMLNKNGELPYPYFVTREEAEKALREKEK